MTTQRADQSHSSDVENDLAARLEGVSHRAPALSSTPTPLETIESDSDTLTKPTQSDEGDHDKFAHYVNKNDITSSAVNGHEVVALCGKKWVPTRVPDDFPVCPDCKRIYDQLRPPK